MLCYSVYVVIKLRYAGWLVVYTVVVLARLQGVMYLLAHGSCNSDCQLHPNLAAGAGRYG